MVRLRGNQIKEYMKFKKLFKDLGWKNDLVSLLIKDIPEIACFEWNLENDILHINLFCYLDEYTFRQVHHELTIELLKDMAVSEDHIVEMFAKTTKEYLSKASMEKCDED